MGTSATERVALLFETRADLSGVVETRAATTALGQAAKEATQQAASGAAAATGSLEALAHATQETAAQQEQLVATVEQSREAWAKAGGDFSKFPAMLAEIVRGENAVATAAREAAEQLDRQAKSAGAVATAGSVQLGPAVPGFRLATPTEGDTQLGPALPGTTTAMAAAASAVAARKDIEKIPPAARTATNALGVLAQAAIMGQGGMNGIAVAAGNVAQGLATMSSSATLAASATGVGALIAVVTLGISALDQFARKSQDAAHAIDQQAYAATVLDSRRVFAEISAAAQRLDELRAQARAAADRDLPGAESLAFTDAGKLHREVEFAEQQLKALHDRAKQLQDEDHSRALANVQAEAQSATTAQGRYAAQLHVIEAERLEAIASRTLSEERANARAAGQIHQLARQQSEYLEGLGSQAAISAAAVTQDTFAQRKLAADLQYADEKRHIQDLALTRDAEVGALDQIGARHRANIALIELEQRIATESLRITALTETDDPSKQFQGRLDQIEAERKAAIRATGDVADANAVAEEKIRKLRKQSRDEGLAGYTALSSAVKNHGTVVFQIAKAAADAVRIHEIAVEGKKSAILAKMEWSAAMAAFGSGNIPGGALHLLAAGGYGAAALAAGAEAAGAMGVGGGGGSGKGGSGAADSVFQARDSQSAGGQVINLYTVDPRNQEIINHTRYELGRAGVLKRPIYVPPTTGLAS
jgi:hypothetical protein